MIDYRNCNIYDKKGVQAGYVKNGEIYEGDGLFVERIGTIKSNGEFYDSDGKFVGSIDKEGNIIEGFGLFSNHVGKISDNGTIYETKGVFPEEKGKVSNDKKKNEDAGVDVPVPPDGPLAYLFGGFLIWLMCQIYLFFKEIFKGIGHLLDAVEIIVLGLDNWALAVWELATHLFDQGHPVYLTVTIPLNIVAILLVIGMHLNKKWLEKEHFKKFYISVAAIGLFIWEIMSIICGINTQEWYINSFSLYAIILFLYYVILQISALFCSQEESIDVVL